MTKVCVFGAGAIGGYMAAALAEAGADVSVVARGPHLAAIKENGLTLRKEGESKTYHIAASDNAADLGAQDYVIIGLKAHSVPPVVDKIMPLVGDQTAIVPAVNGIPWWYFHKAKTGTAMDETWLETVDPGGAQWQAFGPERAIGCVVYPAASIPEPGVIAHKSGDRFTLGEPSGERTDRAMALSRLLEAGGLKAPVKPRIRDELWVKLWGNVSFNPVCALTGASLDIIGGNGALRDVVRRMMLEAKAVGSAAGARFVIDVERRINGGAEIIGHKPSTRQDVEQGRPLEIDALVTAVQELARRLQIDIPTIDAVAAMLRMMGNVNGLYDFKPDFEAMLDPYAARAKAEAAE